MNRRTLLLGACVLPALAACASVNTQQTTVNARQTTTANAVVKPWTRSRGNSCFAVTEALSPDYYCPWSSAVKYSGSMKSVPVTT